MNAKVLLLGVAASLSFTALAADTLLTPRAASNQPRLINSAAPTPAATTADVTPAATGRLSPRGQSNQTRFVPGVARDRNPALECRNTMVASPRAVAACAQSVTMPGCLKLASMK